jgi:putative membrane protein
VSSLQEIDMNSTFARRACAVAVLGAFLSASAYAQYSTPTPATTPAPAKPKATAPATASGLSATDRKFVEEAAVDGMAEVELAKLAQTKGTNSEVKKLATRMVQDHGKANQELQQLAKTKGVQLPTALDDRHKDDMQRLEKLSGADFDREFLKHMVDDHKRGVAEFHKQTTSGRDEQLKSFAAKTLPTLQDHLKEVQSVNERVTKAKGPNPGG